MNLEPERGADTARAMSSEPFGVVPACVLGKSWVLRLFFVRYSPSPNQ